MYAGTELEKLRLEHEVRSMKARESRLHYMNAMKQEMARAEQKAKTGAHNVYGKAVSLEERGRSTVRQHHDVHALRAQTRDRRKLRTHASNLSPVNEEIDIYEVISKFDHHLETTSS